MQSAQKWKEFTGSKEFVEKFQMAVQDKQLSNDDRAATVEKLLLD
jgi:hypothetical protein